MSIFVFKPCHFRDISKFTCTISFKRSLHFLTSRMFLKIFIDHFSRFIRNPFSLLYIVIKINYYVWGSNTNLPLGKTASLFTNCPSYFYLRMLCTSMFRNLLLVARKYILGVYSHRARKQDRFAINTKNLVFDKKKLYACLTNSPLLLDNNSLALLPHKLHQIIWSSCSFICCT